MMYENFETEYNKTLKDFINAPRCGNLIFTKDSLKLVNKLIKLETNYPEYYEKFENNQEKIKC